VGGAGVVDPGRSDAGVGRGVIVLKICLAGAADPRATNRNGLRVRQDKGRKDEGRSSPSRRMPRDGERPFVFPARVTWAKGGYCVSTGTTEAPASPAGNASKGPALVLDAPPWRLASVELYESVHLDDDGRIVSRGRVICAPEGFGVRELPLELTPTYVLLLEAPEGLAIRAMASVTDEQDVTGRCLYEWVTAESGVGEYVLTCAPGGPIGFVDPGVFSFSLTINGERAHFVAARLVEREA
jgi:hypothetical protein